MMHSRDTCETLLRHGYIRTRNRTMGCQVSLEHVDGYYRYKIQLPCTLKETISRDLRQSVPSRNPFHDETQRNTFVESHPFIVTAWGDSASEGTTIGFEGIDPSESLTDETYCLEGKPTWLTRSFSQGQNQHEYAHLSVITTDNHLIFNTPKREVELLPGYFLARPPKTELKDFNYTYYIYHRFTSQPIGSGSECNLVSVSNLFMLYRSLFRCTFELPNEYRMVASEDHSHVLARYVTPPECNFQIVNPFDGSSYMHSVLGGDFRSFYDYLIHDFGFENSMLLLIDLLRTDKTYSMINSRLLLFPIIIEAVVSSALKLDPDAKYINLRSKIQQYEKKYVDSRVDFDVLCRVLIDMNTRNRAAHRLYYDPYSGNATKLLNYWVDTVAMLLCDMCLEHARPRHLSWHDPKELLEILS